MSKTAVVIKGHPLSVPQRAPRVPGGEESRDLLARVAPREGPRPEPEARGALPLAGGLGFPVRRLVNTTCRPSCFFS